jgi:predicted ester cyclase
MSTEQNKVLVRKYFELINNKDLNAALTSISPDIVDHGLRPPMPQGMQGVRIFFNLQFAAFPDMHATIEDMVMEGEKVTVRATVRGTHQGLFMGTPATGKQATWSLIDISRLVNGKIVEHWVEMDTISLMVQLGIVPPLV